MIYVLGHNYPQTDVDSIISSIVLADMLNQKGRPAKPVIINPNAINQVSIDIIGRIGGLELPELETLEEVINYKIVLVDHNNPLESYGFCLTNKAPGNISTIKMPILCIDHHADSGYPAKVKVIERVGSTCTLLTEILRNDNIRLSDLLVRALVYGIVCDTKGLKSRKTCQRDRKAINYLYNNYKIRVAINKVIEHVLAFTDILSMDIEQILSNSLKEYDNGNIGIASIEVLNDDYMTRLEEIKERAVHTKYPLYILMILKQHKNETLVYYFDRKYHVFPEVERYEGLISRSQDLVPYVLSKTAKKV